MTRLREYQSIVRGLATMPFEQWASQFAVSAGDPWVDGSFSLRPRGRDWDLYALVDMLLCAITLEPSQPIMRRVDAQAWADRIMSCLDADGLATRRNLTDHVTEHATAYAYAGLVHLRARGARIDVPPLRYFTSPAFSRTEFESWFNRMGWQVPRWFRGRGLMGSLRMSARHLGWYNFWPGSHVGGGIMATMIMREQLKALDGQVPAVQDVPELDAFFGLANDRIDAGTGCWRPRIKRLLWPQPSVRDVGGAAHFIWLYDRCRVRHPHPEPLLRHALRLQRPSGLFADRPSCLDLDFTNAISYAAHLGAARDTGAVDEAMLRNGLAVLTHVLDQARLGEFADSHSLPGVLCAVAQVDSYIRWRRLDSTASPTRNVLAEACWI